MLRMTALLIVEAVVFATLTIVLYKYAYDVNVVRIVAGILFALTIFVCVMMLGQKKLLRPFARGVGICEVCK